MLKRMVRDFAEKEIAPIAAEIDRSGEFPWECAKKMGNLGMFGLVLPPAVVPTVFWMQTIGIYKTLFSLIFIEVALALPFATIILRAFIGSIPREIDEAAIMDGSKRDEIINDINERNGLTGSRNIWGISGIPIEFVKTLATINELMPM